MIQKYNDLATFWRGIDDAEGECRWKQEAMIQMSQLERKELSMSGDLLPMQGVV